VTLLHVTTKLRTESPHTDRKRSALDELFYILTTNTRHLNMDDLKPAQPVSDTADTDSEPKIQKKQVCRFFTSKGKCSISHVAYSISTLALNTFFYAITTSYVNAANTDDPFQVVAPEMLAHMPTLLGEKDKHLDQNRTGKAVMIQQRRTNNRGDTNLRLSMMLESYGLSRTSRIHELSKQARSRDATSPR
jgi:hypothetical protein